MSLIKCPNCNGNVSTKAGTCPGCSIRISGNLVQCGKCGAYALLSNITCPACGAEVHVPETQGKPTSVAPFTTPGTPKPLIKNAAPKPSPKGGAPKTEKHTPRKFRTGRVACLMLVVAALGAAVAGGQHLYSQWQAEKELKAFEQVMQVTNPDFCQDFLDRFPRSEYCDTVLQRMESLLAEADEWNQIKENPKRADVQRFLDNHPESAYYKDCYDLADSLDWTAAHAKNTEKAVEAYLAAHPDGRYQQEALELQHVLRLCKVTPQNITMVRSVLEAFFTNAYAKGDEASLRSAMATDTIAFCGQNSTAKQIMRYKLSQKEKDVIGKHYVVEGTPCISKKLDANKLIVYEVQCQIKETTSRSNATKSINATYAVEATLNHEFKINAVSIKN